MDFQVVKVRGVAYEVIVKIIQLTLAISMVQVGGAHTCI